MNTPRLAILVIGLLALALPLDTGLAQPVSFSFPPSLAVGTNPTSVAIADLDRDGKLDLVVTNASSNTVSVFLGAGAGSFAAGSTFTVGSGPVSVAIGDFDRDGRPDLAVANRNGNDISIFLGTGSGTFGTATSFTVGSSPESLAIGDFDRDGQPDLAVANFFSNSVSILLGDGTGSFSAATSPTVGSRPVFVAVADLNRDGKSDLAVANRDSSTVSVLLGNGDGTFQAAVNFAVGTFPSSIGISDLNEDGIPDLVVANFQSHNVSVLLGNNTASLFGAATNFAAGDNPASVVIEDLNGDGIPDLAVADSGTGKVLTLLGDGKGSFGSPAGFQVGALPTFVAVADFDRDAKPDLAVVNFTSQSVSVLLNTTVFSPSGTFEPGAGLLALSNILINIAIGDFNRDGKLDLLATEDRSAMSSLVHVRLGDGAGGFLPMQGFLFLVRPIAASLAVGDFNRDGKLDLAVASGSLSVSLGDGTGRFTVGTTVTVGLVLTSLAVGDFNRDGKPDLAVADSFNEKVFILYGSGTGGFNLGSTITVPTVKVQPGPLSVAVGDFNRDGKPDLAVTASDQNFVHVFLGDGQGGFTAGPITGAGLRPRGLAVGDFNRDGKPDLAVADEGSGTVSILMGDGGGSFTAPPTPTVTVGGAPRTVAVGDFNRDGKLDLVTEGHVLFGDGTGSFTMGPRLPFRSQSFSSEFLSSPWTIGDFNNDGKPDVAGLKDRVVASIELNDPDRDDDGISDPIDRNKATGASQSRVVSSDFNDIPLGGTTSGTITDRGGWAVRIVQDVSGIRVAKASISGGGTVARIASCDTGGAEHVLLDGAGETATIKCGSTGSTTVKAVVASPTIEVQKQGKRILVVVRLTTGNSVTLGSPITASADNAEPIAVEFLDGSGALVGSFELDPGEAADVEDTELGTVDVTVLAGTVTVTVAGQTATLASGQARTFVVVPPAVLIANISQKIFEFLVSADIRNEGVANSLQASLNTAAKQIGVNNSAARGTLSALINKLNAFVNGGQITPAVRDTLARPIRALISSLP